MDKETEFNKLADTVVNALLAENKNRFERNGTIAGMMYDNKIYGDLIVEVSETIVKAVNQIYSVSERDTALPLAQNKIRHYLGILKELRGL